MDDTEQLLWPNKNPSILCNITAKHPLTGSLNVEPVTPDSQRSLDMDSECSEKKWVFVIFHNHNNILILRINLWFAFG